jgi:hypothetical protein
MRRLIRHLSQTEADDGNFPTLDTAVAVLIWLVASRQRAVIAAARAAIVTTIWFWALNRPTPPKMARTAWSTLYGQRKIVTGAIMHGSQGHHPIVYMDTSIALAKELAAVKGPGGHLLHPRFGKVLIMDGMRVRAPVPQKIREDVLRKLCGASKAWVDIIPYVKRRLSGGRFMVSIVVGWKVVALLDQSTGTIVVAALVRGRANEREVMMVLIRQLYDSWPELEPEFLVCDGELDAAETCGELEALWGIHPVFPVPLDSQRKGVAWVDRAPAKEGEELHASVREELTTINGQPVCRCGQLMAFKTREGFLTPAARRKLGIPLGVMPSEGMLARPRIRWFCADCALECSTKPLERFTRDGELGWWHASHFTFLPIQGGLTPGRKKDHSAFRRALLLSRNAVESAFANLARAGMNSNEPMLWASDRSAAHFIGMYTCMMLAIRLAHDNGDFKLLAAEAEALGLKDDLPNGVSAEVHRFAMEQRPERLRWDWPEPGRISNWSDELDQAAESDTAGEPDEAGPSDE